MEENEEDKSTWKQKQALKNNTEYSNLCVLFNYSTVVIPHSIVCTSQLCTYK